MVTYSLCKKTKVNINDNFDFFAGMRYIQQNLFCFINIFVYGGTAAVAQWVKALAPHAEDWVSESKLRQT